MWNSTKSVILSLICTKIAIVLVFATAIEMPILTLNGYFITWGIILAKDVPLWLVVIIGCCIFAEIALFALDRLLTNIRRGDVFTEKNVSLLRAISWACFLVAIVLISAGSFVSFVFPVPVLSVVAAFFGLILRVVKNVVSAAVDLKDENDYTI